MTDVPDRLLTAAEVADRLAVTERWVKDSARRNDLPSVALGRYRRFHWPSIQAWLAQQHRGGNTLPVPRKRR